MRELGSKHNPRDWKARKQLWLLPLLSVALAIAAWINLPTVSRLFDGSVDRVAALPVAAPFQKGQRILVLSPHPDDETLCCGAMIQQAHSAGAEVFIVWATPGDGFEFDAVLTQKVADPTPQDMQKLGNTRALEAKAAARVLGVPADHTFMLGYPDGGLFQLFTTHYDEPYTAKHTRADRVYIAGALSPGSAYTGRRLEADLRTVLERVQPDVVLAPAPQDFHPDHHTLSYIALRLMSERKQEGRLRFWVVHGGLEWPIPKGLHEDLPLTLPPLASKLPWERVPVTPEQEQVKLQAVDTYRTQTAVMGRFMRAYVRRNELLSPEPLPETVSGSP